MTPTGAPPPERRVHVFADFSRRPPSLRSCTRLPTLVRPSRPQHLAQPPPPHVIHGLALGHLRALLLPHESHHNQVSRPPQPLLSREVHGVPAVRPVVRRFVGSFVRSFLRSFLRSLPAGEDWVRRLVLGGAGVRYSVLKRLGCETITGVVVVGQDRNCERRRGRVAQLERSICAGRRTT